MAGFLRGGRIQGDDRGGEVLGVTRGSIVGVERRNWALEMRSQGTKRVQGGAVVQRMLKSLRALGLEEKERLPKPWKEVGRKGSSTAANLRSTSTLPGKEKSPEVPLLGNSFFLPDRQATERVFVSDYVFATLSV